MDKILAWMDSEPVITRIGPLVTLVVAYLLARGAIDRNTYDFVLAVASLLLGVGGIAGARAAVTPTMKLQPKQPDAPSGGSAD